MHGTNTVETNMEALPRQKQNCQGQLNGSVGESSCYGGCWPEFNPKIFRVARET